MSTTASSVMRQRAVGLRRLARQLETTPAMRLDAHAGIDTWRGPRPDECRRLLHAAQQRVHAAAEALRSRAWAFDQRADEIDRVQALFGPSS